MSRVIKSLVVLVLLFSLAACLPKPVFTMEVLKTPTSVSLPVEPTLAATSPTEFPTLEFTPTALSMPSDFSPILYGLKYDANTFFILLGGVQGGTWLAADQAATYIVQPQGWEYDVYPLAKQNFQVHGHQPEFSPPNHEYFIGTDITIAEFGMVGVAQGWPVLKRDVQELSSDNELYQSAVLDWLASEGISQPQLGTLRIYRVDIEGDGVDEIFINATHLDDTQHTTKSGDYSVILMRKVAGNDAVTLPIVGDVYHSQEAEITFPQAYSLGNFMDLNQDGVLEVVVDIQRWEGDGAAIYQINGQEITQVP
jgi:hypothetical protein